MRSERHGSAALPSAWRLGAEPGKRLPEGLLRRPVAEVAPRLLGARLVSSVEGRLTSGVIVEVEAYAGPDDPASHAARRIGRTPRNESMFGPPGTAYVYLIYGIHWCVNIVTGQPGVPSAVLVRALEPLVGMEEMTRRRGGATALCSGPARLCQALHITGDLDGHDLSRPPLELLPGWPVPPDRIVTSGRIGVRHAADWPLRFFLEGHPCVSRSR